MEILIVITDIIEKLLLFTLFALSIWSISIIIDRYRILKAQKKQNNFDELKNLIKKHQTKNYLFPKKNLFIVGVFKTLIESQQNSEALNAATSSYVKEEKMKLEKGMAVLATLGANAPFIGLFGTVLGIIRSFAYLGAQSGTSTVMSGISQALFATAFGLFVAIPAVVAFNTFTKLIKDLVTHSESLRDLYISELGATNGRG